MAPREVMFLLDCSARRDTEALPDVFRHGRHRYVLGARQKPFHHGVGHHRRPGGAPFGPHQGCLHPAAGRHGPGVVQGAIDSMRRWKTGSVMSTATSRTGLRRCKARPEILTARVLRLAATPSTAAATT